MKFNPRIQLCLLIIGLWVVIYFSYTILLPIITARSKFDIEKFENINYFLNTDSRQSYFAYNLLPETDYNRLINISFDFPLITFVCEDANPLLLILIHSSPINFAKRKVIRDTWGRKDEDIKVLFLLGSTSSQKVNEKIKDENNLHRDIIQGSFLDSYHNLTYKHTMALKYVVYHCPHTKYVLKTDDDIFVNLPLLRNFLTRDLSPLGAKKLLMCRKIFKVQPYRTYRSKWHVSFSEYQYKYYPPYCLGWSILYSPDIIFDLYKEAQTTTYFWIDDVFITGIVAEKINFKNHVNITPLILSSKEIRAVIDDYNSQNVRIFLFGPANLEEEEIRSLWKYVVNNPSPKSVRRE